MDFYDDDISVWMNNLSKIFEQGKVTFDDELDFGDEIEFEEESHDIGVKKVIFNDPATIVYWADGTKTVVKATGADKFNKEAGIGMAFMKRVMGDGYASYLKNIYKNCYTVKVTKNA